MKKIGILIGILTLITLVGCTNKTINTDEAGGERLSAEGTSEVQSTDMIHTIASPESMYGWKSLQKSIGNLVASGDQKNGNYYLMRRYLVPTLCEEDNIFSIEYYIENGTGTFMDTNTSPFADNVTNKPYLLGGSNQDGIYFSVYFIFQNYNYEQLTNKEELKIATPVVEKMHIRLTITYQDGSVKIRKIGFKNRYNFNYNTFEMYELTMPE